MSHLLSLSTEKSRKMAAQLSMTWNYSHNTVKRIARLFVDMQTKDRENMIHWRDGWKIHGVNTIKRELCTLMLRKSFPNTSMMESTVMLIMRKLQNSLAKLDLGKSRGIYPNRIRRNKKLQPKPKRKPRPLRLQPNLRLQPSLKLQPNLRLQLLPSYDLIYCFKMIVFSYHESRYNSPLYNLRNLKTMND